MATSARSQTRDPFLTNRFSLVVHGGPAGILANQSAYFQSISMPEQTVEQIEYSEGIYTYSRSYPGRSSFGTISCSKGVVFGDGFLGRWIRNVSEGGWRYRSNISIHQYHREDVSGQRSYRRSDPSREILMINCYPVRYKPGSDFDAMSAEISIEEIEFSMERFIVLSKATASDENRIEVK